MQLSCRLSRERLKTFFPHGWRNGKKSNLPEKKKYSENPIHHIIRALSLVPSHLAEFYSHKERCPLLVICFVMEGPCAAAGLWGGL